MKKTQFMSGMATALMSLSLLQAADTCTRWNKLEVTGGQFVSADGMIVSAYMTISRVARPCASMEKRRSNCSARARQSGR